MEYRVGFVWLVYSRCKMCGTVESNAIMVRKNIPVNTQGKDLSTTGGRLAGERMRVGFTVLDFALLCGVTKQTQIKYESNANAPDTRYLERCLERGVDVMYVITGERSASAPLNPEYQNLIAAYEAAPEPLRRAVFGVLLSPYKREWEMARKRPGYFKYEILGEEDVRYTKGPLATPTDGDAPEN